MDHRYTINIPMNQSNEFFKYHRTAPSESVVSFRGTSGELINLFFLRFFVLEAKGTSF